MTEPATSPLAHARILDLSRMLPGAFCTLMLADLGADVLKVEAPGTGDGLRFMTGEPFPAAHVALNRGKRSLTLNLKSTRAPEVLRRLVRGADVVVESHKPGLLDAAGIGFEDLRTEQPGLVWCSLTGFGPDGPNAAAPGHDMTYLGYSGVLSMLTVDGVPPVAATTITLPVTGLMGALGIVAALTHRDRTGEGSRVDVNMADSAMWLLAEQLARAANAPGPAWGASARRANYRCADGRWVTCTASEPRPWAALVEAIGAPELADVAMGSDEQATAARLADAFARQPQAHWLAHPGLAGGIGPVYEPADLVSDPQVTHRNGMVRVGDGGPVVFANPLRIDRSRGDEGSNARSSPPALGEHTDDALAAVGYSAEEIAALHTEGAV
ncbi:MAG TPA: CaiB/BaiF CoA-transferase family protein [Acidimicrobiales bacterium]|nr:CaiB/BaiF CoA-transferase family protein [Acidimicrobiales bacterium]